MAWEKLCKSPRYFYAVNNTQAVGYLAADMVRFLVDRYEKVTMDNVHPIGMSLGAHVVGHLGYHLNGSLSRITGLDPAGKPIVMEIFIVTCYSVLFNVLLKLRFIITIIP